MGIFLFVTANEHEKKAFEQFFKRREKKHINAKNYYLGDFGSYKAAYIHIDEQGGNHPAATPLVGELIRKIKPVAVVMVGIAFGANKDTQNIGDILVSKQILPYDSQKFLDTGTNYKETPKDVGYQLLNAFSISEDWLYQLDDGRKPMTYVGAILTGSILINNYEYRTKLLNDFSMYNPIGGEMEAYGIYSVCRTHGVTEWIIIKGICDWGYEKNNPNKEHDQFESAKAAVNFCHHIFSQDDVFDDLDAAKAVIPSGNDFIKYNQCKEYKAYVNNLVMQMNNYSRLDATLNKAISLKFYERKYGFLDNTKLTNMYNIFEIVGKINNLNYILFNAPSGAGKTVTLRQLCIMLAENLLSKQTDSFIVPIWIDLKYYNCIDYIKQTSKLRLNKYDITIDYTNQKICYLLDGLNEVPIMHIQQCLSEIASLKEDYLVITSRPFGSKPNDFTTYNIYPLTSDEIIDIARLFFDHSEQLEKFKQRFATLNISIKETMSKPLFLKLILLIFQEYGDIPSQMSVIMREFFKWLYSQWEPSKVQSNIPVVLKDMVAQKIAFSMQKVGRIILTTEEALKLAGEVCMDLSKKQIIQQGTFDGISVLQALYYHGILEDDGQKVNFYHQSFQEYYAAKELLCLFLENKKEYKKYFLLKNWESIVSFLPGITEDIEEIIKNLICYPKYDKSFSLAIQIAYQEGFSESIRQIIDNQIKAMLLCENLDDRDDYQRESTGALEEITRYTALTKNEIDIIRLAISNKMVVSTKERLVTLLENK
jgi:nucleoside phosphorylase